MNNTEKTQKEDMLEAVVSAVHKDRFEVMCKHGVCGAVLKRSVFSYVQAQAIPTVGDIVSMQFNPMGDSIIYSVTPRKTVFYRLDPSSAGHREQAVAANFDYVFVVTSLNMDLNLKRIERYLTQSWQSGAVPVVVLTKADLVENPEQYADTVRQIAVGVSVFAVSAHTGEGLMQLAPYIQPENTIVLLGSSGTGKSSLVNALDGEAHMKVSSIRESDSRGRHTTTHRQLIQLKSGGRIIDTPGMRSLGIWDVSSGLSSTFQQVDELFALCQFSNCTHAGEPGCAVEEALRSGQLSQERWNNYMKIKKEAKFLEQKEFVKHTKQRKSNRYKKIRQNKFSENALDTDW